MILRHQHQCGICLHNCAYDPYQDETQLRAPDASKHFQLQSSIQCTTCAVAVHQSCYREYFRPSQAWQCDRCKLSRQHMECVLCSRSAPSLVMKKINNFNRQNNNWAHVYCSKFHSEIIVDLISNELCFDPSQPINDDKFLGECSICGQEATSPSIMPICAKCAKPVHLSCLEQAGYGSFEYVEQRCARKVGLLCCTREPEFRVSESVVYPVERHDGLYHCLMNAAFEASDDLPQPTEATLNQQSNAQDHQQAHPALESAQPQLQEAEPQPEECAFCPTIEGMLPLGLFNPSLLVECQQIRQVIREGDQIEPKLDNGEGSVLEQTVGPRHETFTPQTYYAGTDQHKMDKLPDDPIKGHGNNSHSTKTTEMPTNRGQLTVPSMFTESTVVKAHESCTKLFTDHSVVNSIAQNKVFECQICFDTNGICFKCTNDKCDNYMHASCAQLRGIFNPAIDRFLCKGHSQLHNQKRGELFQDADHYYLKLPAQSTSKPSQKKPITHRKSAQTLKQPRRLTKALQKQKYKQHRATRKTPVSPGKLMLRQEEDSEEEQRFAVKIVDGIQYMELINWDDYNDYFGPVKQKDRNFLQDCYKEAQEPLSLKYLVDELKQAACYRIADRTADAKKDERIRVMLDTEESAYLLTYAPTSSFFEISADSVVQADEKSGAKKHRTAYKMDINNLLFSALKGEAAKRSKQDITITASDVKELENSYSLASLKDVTSETNEIRAKNDALLFGQTMGLLNPDVSDEISENILTLTQMLNSTKQDLAGQLKNLLVKSSSVSSPAVNPQLAFLRRAETQDTHDRVRRLQCWQTLLKCFRLSFSLNDRTHACNIIEDAKFCCSVCFHQDQQTLNPIVYCEICEIGTHMNCHGLPDPEQLFTCFKCLDYEKDKRSKLHSDKDKKVNQLIRLHKINRRQALRMYYDDLKCFICCQSGGLMMKTESASHRFGGYYHPFCGYFTGRHIDVEKMAKFRLRQACRLGFGQQCCYVCGERSGVCLQCEGCDRSAHPLCLWLDGTVFNQNEATASSHYLQLDFESLRTSKVRGMFHAIGPGSNGWYFDDPALKQDFSNEDVDIMTLKEEAVEPRIDFMGYESSEDEPLGTIDDEMTFYSQKSQGLLSSAKCTANQQAPFFKHIKVTVNYRCRECQTNEASSFLKQIRAAKFTSQPLQERAKNDPTFEQAPTIVQDESS